MFGYNSHFFTHLFSPDGFPARWVCGSGWSAFTGWLYIVSDIAIWGAYFTIPLVLAIYIKRKKNVPFPKIIWLFAAFIFSCGLTHLVDAIMFWYPVYRLNGLLLAITAIISWVTVFALIPIIKIVMQLKTPEELEHIIEERIQELTLAKTQAEHNEARFRRIMDANIIGLFFADFNGQILESNDAFLNMVGYDQTDITNKTINWLNLTPEEFTHPDNQIIEKITKTGVSGLYEKQYFHKSGHRVDVLLSIALLNEVEPVCVVLALDMTQKKNDQRALKSSEENIQQLNELLEAKVVERTAELEIANQQMQLAYKELESFSYSVSHDLRAPLRSLDGFSTILLNDYTDKLDDMGKDYLNRIRSNSQKMGDLINHLLKLAQVTRVNIHKQSINLSEMCLELLNEKQELNRDRVVTFIVEPNVTCYADPILIHAVMTNLFNNAWKFTQTNPDAIITFGTCTISDRLLYFVKDNGAGFDMAYASKLFGVFQRLHSDKQYEGTGIGLATVQRIIHRHGGTIWAEAEPDKGATFFFTL